MNEAQTLRYLGQIVGGLVGAVFVLNAIALSLIQLLGSAEFRDKLGAAVVDASVDRVRMLRSRRDGAATEADAARS